MIQASWPCHPFLTFHNPISPTKLTKTLPLTHHGLAQLLITSYSCIHSSSLQASSILFLETPSFPHLPEFPSLPRATSSSTYSHLPSPYSHLTPLGSSVILVYLNHMQSIMLLNCFLNVHLISPTKQVPLRQ